MCFIAKKHTITQPPFFPLPPAEHRTLQAICDAFLPALTPEAGDDSDLFALSADRLNVAGGMERSFAKLDPAQQQQIHNVLHLLEHPLFIASRVHKLKGFSQLAQADRVRVLQTLAVSKVEMLRMTFFALKRLALFIF